MRWVQTILLFLLAATVAVAGYLTLRGFGLLGAARLAEVQPVPTGHAEIAWISAATSGDAWERLVAAVRRLRERWAEHHPEGPSLDADLDHVFSERTTDVPELALWLGGREDAKLWIRWYKTGSEIDAPTWIDRLAQRARPPLAILGGENSERALAVANILKEYRGRWHGPDPLFLITTATADRYTPADGGSEVPLTTAGTPKLMDVYEGRSFRFSFTNRRMAAVVMGFVKDHPEIWAHSPHYAAALAGSVAASGGPAGLPLLGCADQLPPIYHYAVAWADDPYSRDLADRFGEVFREQIEEPGLLPLAAASPFKPRIRDEIPYGVGDRDRPNPAEAFAIDHFFERNPLQPGNRELLVLPTSTERARRFLRTLANQAPLAMENLVVLSGDSLTFNNVYRDRDVAWNVQDLPVPLVFFSHRNPINPAAGFRTRAETADPSATTGTQDLLLYRDVVEALVQAAGEAPGDLGDADHVGRRLRQLRWLTGRVRTGSEGTVFFDEDGDRSAGTGEHVIWLRPMRRDGRVLAQATITVWRLGPQQQGRAGWVLAGPPLEVLYDWPSRSSGQ
jgi:hypothetical protein